VALNFGILITARRALFYLPTLLPLTRVQTLYAFGLLLGTLYSVPPFRLKVRTLTQQPSELTALLLRSAFHCPPFSSLQPCAASYSTLACTTRRVLQFGYHSRHGLLKQRGRQL